MLTEGNLLITHFLTHFEGFENLELKVVVVEIHINSTEEQAKEEQIVDTVHDDSRVSIK